MGAITDTFKQRWVEFWVHAINNPKTSASGICSFVAVFSLSIAEFIPHSNKIYAILIAIAAVTNKMFISFSQKDPGKELVKTPDNPVPHPEPSTEIPLNPEAEVVK